MSLDAGVAVWTKGLKTENEMPNSQIEKRKNNENVKNWKIFRLMWKKPTYISNIFRIKNNKILYKDQYYSYLHKSKPILK